MMIEIQMYGGLRAFAPGGRLRLELDGDATTVLAAELKTAVANNLGAAAATWVASSVVATGDRILAERESVPLTGEIALLPPVNGG